MKNLLRLGLIAAFITGCSGDDNTNNTPVENENDPDPILDTTSSVRVHYRRNSEDYDGWNIHLWGGATIDTDWWPGNGATKVFFEDSNDFGRYTDIEITDEEGEFFFHIHQLLDVDGMPSHQLDDLDQSSEIWIMQNDPRLYTSEPIPVETFELSLPSSSTLAGESIQLSVNITPSDIPASEIVWTSDNEAVATVDQNGLVTALRGGNSTIRARLRNMRATVVARVMFDDGQALYQHIEPPAGYETPEALEGDTWMSHLVEDILPFWTTEVALGTPQGNFPTHRNNAGEVIDEARKPRMIARQTYLYSVAYMMTGENQYLQYAKDGVDWIIENAVDNVNGGWYADLDGQGNGLGEGDKTTQDFSYNLLGLASYFFITRDAAVEQILLENRDFLFDTFWDADREVIIDGLDHAMENEIDQQDGGLELVAMLDQINAFMMLTQPVLSDEANRSQWLDDMELLADSMVREFWGEQNGIFWGQAGNIGNYLTRHVDFGHTLKSYWMLLQLDKRLPNHPYFDLVHEGLYKWLNLAYDENLGAWYQVMGSENDAWGTASWWVYAEADQLAATVNLLGYSYSDTLETRSTFWRENFVDEEFGGILSGPGMGDKANQWNSGFHSAEHALVMYLLGKNLEQQPSQLYFAVSADSVDNFIAKPYIFDGEEVGRESGEVFTVDGANLTEVRVSFDNLY